jgi:transcriptional regulator with XRE-family HTH domain
MKDPREYPSYRDYLTDCHRSEEKSSLRKFSARLGFSESSLRMILSGQRNLTIHNVHVIAKALKLSDAQLAIFEAMVLRDQAETPGEKAFYQKRLKKSEEDYPLRDLRVSSKALMKNWFSPVLLTYLVEKNLRAENLTDEGCRELARRLGSSPQAIQKTAKAFDAEGLLQNEGQTAPLHFIFDQMTSHLSKKNYVVQTFSEVMKRIETDYENPQALFSVKTLAMEPRLLRAFGKDYKTLLEKYMARPNADNADSQRDILQVTFSAQKVL